MKFFVYILQSIKDDSLYVGYTSNLEYRLKEHNAGASRYSSRKKPWKIVYYEEHNAKTEAIKRERFLKNQRNREFYNRLIKEFKVKRTGSSVG